MVHSAILKIWFGFVPFCGRRDFLNLIKEHPKGMEHWGILSKGEPWSEIDLFYKAHSATWWWMDWKGTQLDPERPAGSWDQDIDSEHFWVKDIWWENAIRENAQLGYCVEDNNENRGCKRKRRTFFSFLLYWSVWEVMRTAGDLWSWWHILQESAPQAQHEAECHSSVLQ